MVHKEREGGDVRQGRGGEGERERERERERGGGATHLAPHLCVERGNE